MQRSWSAAIWPRGTATRCSPTGSRTSPAPSGRSLEALAGRGEVTVSLPYELGRPVFALAGAHRHRPDPARGWPHRGAAARPVGTGAGARAPRAHALRLGRARRGATAARRRGSLPRGRRDARRARARRRGDPGAAARRSAPDEIAVVWRRAWSACARRSRPPSACSASRTRSRGAIPLDRTPFGRALLGLLRFAWLGGDAAPALRLPALALLGAAPQPRRLRRRAGCAAARSPIRLASRRRP